ncbi:hypothetical protein DITRI_Ditri16bG0145700 [Diplodiscus trichospermus]
MVASELEEQADEGISSKVEEVWMFRQQNPSIGKKKKKQNSSSKLKEEEYEDESTSSNVYAIADANGIPAQTGVLPRDQPLLLPIDCKCNNGFYHADLTTTTIKGESFDGIAESLEGLTTCKAIREKNPGVSPLDLAEKVQLLIPVRCACPISI